MLQAINIAVFLILLPLRLIAGLCAMALLLAMYVLGMGQSYLAVIVRNIITNSFLLKTSDLNQLRRRHTHIMGATGSGKSSAIEHFIDENIQKGQGFLLIEPHGELCQRVLHNKRFSLEHSSKAYDKLVFLDFDQAPPALNFFKLPLPNNEKIRASFIDGLSTEVAEALCMNMKPIPTEAQFIMLRNCLISGMYSQHSTFEDLVNILNTNDSNRLRQYTHNTPLPALVQYFHSDFLSSSATRSKEALRLRLTNLVIPQSLYSSFCADRCDVNFAHYLEHNCFVVVRASVSLLGCYQAQTIGNLIVNLLNKYAFERLLTSKPLPPFFVYLDEAQYYINPTVQRALTGVRKTGLNYTLAHQELCQEDMTLGQQRTIINNTAVKVYGRLQWKDRKEALSILGAKQPEILDRLRPGQFMVNAGGSRLFKMKFPAKFSAPKNTFGQRYCFDAYMSKSQHRDLLSYLRKKQTNGSNNVIREFDESPLEERQSDIQKVSYKSFDISGSKPF